MSGRIPEERPISPMGAYLRIFRETLKELQEESLENFLEKLLKEWLRESLKNFLKRTLEITENVLKWNSNKGFWRLIPEGSSGELSARFFLGIIEKITGGIFDETCKFSLTC